tara:strand:+ start:478 stop:2238 length:1761 start_codon:yes stop_codon:yes gene_type:complete
MVESVLYQGRRVALRIPETQALEAQAIERGQATLQRSLDRMTNFFAEQNRIVAKIEGEEYGAANAPTLEQIKAARETGEELKLPGNNNSLFGRAARQAAATVVASELELAAKQEMNAAILDFETREANPAGLQDKLDAIIQGYSSTFDETVPSMARSMKAKLALNANTKYASYHSSYIRNQKDKSKSAWMASAQIDLENMGELLRVNLTGLDANGQIEAKFVDADTLASLKANKLAEMQARDFSPSEIKAWSSAWDAQSVASATQLVNDNILTLKNPDALIRNIARGDVSKLDVKTKAAISILQNNDLSFAEIAQNLRNFRSNELAARAQQEAVNDKKQDELNNGYAATMLKAINEGDATLFNENYELLNKFDKFRAEELRTKYLEAGLAPAISDAGSFNYLQRLGANIGFDDVDKHWLNLSLGDRDEFYKKAEFYQNIETQRAVDKLLGDMKVPENYQLLDKKDPNYKKGFLAQGLVAKLENEAFTFQRLDQDFDALGFVQSLLDEFNDDIEAAVKNVQVVAANKFITLINTQGQLNLELGDFNTAISTLEGFKGLLENRQALPGELDFSVQELDAIISKIEEAL